MVLSLDKPEVSTVSLLFSLFFNLKHKCKKKMNEHVEKKVKIACFF